MFAKMPPNPLDLVSKKRTYKKLEAKLKRSYKQIEGNRLNILKKKQP